MSDDDLIGYCEIHCETERALFSRQQVNRMIELAGFPEHFVGQIRQSWISLHEEMAELVKLAKKRKAEIQEVNVKAAPESRFYRAGVQPTAVVIPFCVNKQSVDQKIIEQIKGKQMNFQSFEDSEDECAAAQAKAVEDRNADVACHNAMVEANAKLKAEIARLQAKIVELEKDVGRLASNNVALRQEFCQPKLF